MAIIDDISLKVTDGGVENIEYEIKNLRSATIQMLCPEILYQKKHNEKMCVESISGLETIIHEEVESFQKKKWL